MVRDSPLFRYTIKNRKTMTNQNSPIEINLTLPNKHQDIRIVLNGTAMRLVPDDTKQPGSGMTLRTMAARINEELKAEGRLRSAEIYRTAVNSFSRFLPDGDIDFRSIDEHLMRRYQTFLNNRNLKHNTIAFYMRVIRAIYRRAVEEGLTADRQPFLHVTTTMTQTNKRAISIDTIRRISQLEGLTEKEQLARDLFLFSFYTRGMSYVDMAYLTPQNISGGILTYRRRKSRQQLSIRWEPAMQDIVDRHPSSNPDYLLPIIKNSNGHERSQYRESYRVINELLQQIGKRLDLPEPLTTYVTRHSWASIARTLDAPISVISEGMGHTSESTTNIYLRTLDTSKLDNLNSSIIRSVNMP